jgi:hypothetical protein
MIRSVIHVSNAPKSLSIGRFKLKYCPLSFIKHYLHYKVKFLSHYRDAREKYERSDLVIATHQQFSDWGTWRSSSASVSFSFSSLAEQHLVPLNHALVDWPTLVLLDEVWSLMIAVGGSGPQQAVVVITQWEDEVTRPRPN